MKSRSSLALSLLAVCLVSLGSRGSAAQDPFDGGVIEEDDWGILSDEIWGSVGDYDAVIGGGWGGDRDDAVDLFQILPWEGGAGGSPFVVGCGVGEVAVGLYGRSGDYVDQMGVICAPVRFDGSVGDAMLRGSTGGSGGIPYHAQCPYNQVLVGMRGRSGTYLDQIGILCAPIPEWSAFGVVRYADGQRGGPGGSEFWSACPQGMALTQLTGRSGAIIDGLQGVCARIWAF